MGLYMYFFDHAKYVQRYNCSFYSVDQIPLEKRRHPYFGVLIIVFGLFYGILYVPIIYALSRKRVRQLSFCYEIMLLMAVYDVMCMPISTLLSGYFSINGHMYCTRPTLMYFSGIIAMSLWSGYCQTAILLAFNRCMLLSNWSDLFFRGTRRFLWFLYPISCSLIILFFGSPAFYNSYYDIWLLDPHDGYVKNNKMEYLSVLQMTNNFMLVIILPLVYLAFFLNQCRFAGNRSNQVNSKDYALFVQTLIVNITIVTATFGYSILQFIDLPIFLLPLMNLSWACVEGAPAILYLLYNNAIRRVVFREIGWIVKLRQRVGIKDPVVSTQHNASNSNMSRRREDSSSRF